MNILLVEDERALHEAIKLNMELEGFKVISAFDGTEAIEIHKNTRIDLILLDVMMPKLNGFDVCEKIRLSDHKTPILFLTARGESEDKIKGLTLGADDYITKPFNTKELVLRIKNILKRINPDQTSSWSEYNIDGHLIDLNSYSVKKSDNTTVQLSEKQAKLLKLLIDNKENVVSRKEILEKIWEYERIPNTRTIDNVILSFRKIFDSKQHSHFQSVRGVGYKFTEKKA
ncbi:response regulator transcription factor [Parvicella tangerina]|uniref:Transcriptional regulatory protein WalR n=1 Tax=Parvicella tangerina TaxID=2829795 RepID=A0A916JPW3_9FLAO|nr:response regulator transcription factor [Parvicella tangerina]CAG5085244.1 Transcriptional regulatory protein WalR [Parvicella tangerina]